MRTVLEKDFNAAVSELSAFIVSKAAECKARGWNYHVSDNAPETYEALKQYADSRELPIAGYACDTAIFTPEVNQAFRFWHDVRHLELDKGFTLLDELAVASDHIDEARQAGLSPLAIEILNADTSGQSLYHDRWGDFPANQTAFVWSCLQHGLKTARIVQH